jgi:group I intron endonuclease
LRKCSIYLIKNIIDNKCYVGQTFIGIEQRFKEHCNNGGAPKLYNAIKFHGVENFKVQFLKFCDTKTEADYWENWYIEYYKSIENGYNIKINSLNDDLIKISLPLAEEIRLFYLNNKFSQKEIGEKFNLNFSIINDIINNRIFKTELNLEILNKIKNKLFDTKNGKLLTFDQAQEIRIKYIEKKISSKDLAKEYNVGCNVILSILNNIYYIDENINLDLFDKIKEKLKNGNSSLTVKLADEIRNLYLDGYGGSSKLAKKYKVDKTVILDVLNNRSYFGNLTEDKLNLIKEKIEASKDIRPNEEQRKLISEKISGKLPSNSKLTLEKADLIRIEYLNNKTHSSNTIGKKYDLRGESVRRLLNNLRYSTPLGEQLLPEIKKELAKGNRR